MERCGPRVERLASIALFFLLLLASPALAGPLTLSPVGNPVPGVGPVGLAVAETSGGTYALIADHQGNTIRGLRFDPATGTLSPIGSVPLANNPSALAVSRDGRFVLATTLLGNDVTSYALDPNTGTLSAVGAIPTGGNGPLSLGACRRISLRCD